MDYLVHVEIISFSSLSSFFFFFVRSHLSRGWFVGVHYRDIGTWMVGYIAGFLWKREGRGRGLDEVVSMTRMIG